MWRSPHHAHAILGVGAALRDHALWRQMHAARSEPSRLSRSARSPAVEVVSTMGPLRSSVDAGGGVSPSVLYFIWMGESGGPRHIRPRPPELVVQKPAFGLLR